VRLIGEEEDVYQRQTLAHPLQDRESAQTRIEESDH
jgi:hypothetical protein